MNQICQARLRGDISNSYRFQEDMPVYSKTYITYGRSMTRGGNEATHNHGHQIESMCSYVAQMQDGNANLYNVNFRGYSGGSGPIGRCGDTHHPPNSRSDYDYNNSTLVASDIKDWKPAGGTTTLVNNNTWGSIPYQWPSALYPSMPPGVESNWYIMMMQSMPGNGNQIPYGSKWMTNWWRFLGDWDSTTVKIGLYQNLPESNANSSCFPTSVDNLINTHKIKLFPNPVKDQLYFAEQPINCEYRVVNINGQVVLSGKGYSNNFNIHQLQGGIYYLEIKEKEKLSVGKFYKQ